MYTTADGQVVFPSDNSRPPPRPDVLDTVLVRVVNAIYERLAIECFSRTSSAAVSPPLEGVCAMTREQQQQH